MYTINARNVNEAYCQGLTLLRREGTLQRSRAGDVLVADCPVVTVYSRPEERVLHDTQRNANPFFHLFESLWMLAGRRDAAYLNTFVRDFGDRYAEADGYLHGAYGHRWRSHWNFDQLETIVHRLRRDPLDRRVVLSMWDPTSDLVGPDDVDPDTGEAIWEAVTEPRDLPCNTHVYPRVHEFRGSIDRQDLPDKLRGTPHRVLDLTVLCRSNDVVWGAYGANAVHFSVLQEYLAARIGVGVGTMYQFSNNWHGYTSVVEKMGTPSTHDPYAAQMVSPVPMFDTPSQADRDIANFLGQPLTGVFANDWFYHTAQPMYLAHKAFREGNVLVALDWADRVLSSDWGLAAGQWIERRMQP